jgi:hypothetical protein
MNSAGRLAARGAEGGSARFLLPGEPFHGTLRIYGFGGLRFLALLPDFDSASETPMERFRTLTRRLLRVSPQELARQRERHSAGKDKKPRKH